MAKFIMSSMRTCKVAKSNISSHLEGRCNLPFLKFRPYFFPDLCFHTLCNPPVGSPDSTVTQIQVVPFVLKQFLNLCLVCRNLNHWWTFSDSLVAIFVVKGRCGLCLLTQQPRANESPDQFSPTHGGSCC